MKFCKGMHSASLHATKSWKLEFLKSQDGGQSPFWKLATVETISTKFHSHAQHPTKSWKLQFLRIQDGGRSPFWKNLKLLYLSNCWNYCDEILHGDTRQKSASYQKLKIRFFNKMADSLQFENFLTAILLQSLKLIAMIFSMVMHGGAALQPINSWKLQYIKIQDIWWRPCWQI